MPPLGEERLSSAVALGLGSCGLRSALCIMGYTNAVADSTLITVNEHTPLVGGGKPLGLKHSTTARWWGVWPGLAPTRLSPCVHLWASRPSYKRK